MGRKAINVYFRLVMLIASIITMVFTLMGLYGGDSLPVNGMFSAVLTFILPILLLLNIFFLFYWIFRRKLFIIIPLLTLITCYNYIGTLFQFSGIDKKDEPHITVSTFNVRLFNNETTGVLAQYIKAMMLDENVDVICFQEYNDKIGGQLDNVTGLMNDAYPYHVQGKPDMAIFSKFPIKATKSFSFDFSNNSFMWADIVLPNNKVVRVFNVHMESTGINSTLHSAEKQRFETYLQNDTIPTIAHINNNELYEALLGNYVLSLVVRSGQAQFVLQEKLKSPYPIILCGDFNDVPYSYTYNLLLGNLKDGFKEGGDGFMYTYRGARGIFRIDYIFHDNSFRCIDYYKLDKEFSDHNPVFSRIVL